MPLMRPILSLSMPFQIRYSLMFPSFDVKSELSAVLLRKTEKKPKIISLGQTRQLLSKEFKTYRAVSWFCVLNPS
jgi:hypothetical protein